MAFTPYPDLKRENPSIVVSNDGKHWIVPPGLRNPVVTNSESIMNGYLGNSDPCLIINRNGVMMLYYRPIYGGQGGNEALYLKTSRDGVNWSSGERLLHFASKEAKNIASPAIVQEADGSFSMWSVNLVEPDSRKRIEKRVSADGRNWSPPVKTSVQTDDRIWHIDVQRVDGRYYMLYVDEVRWRVAFLSSDDGMFWRVPNAVPYFGSQAAFQGNYKSCFVGNPERPTSLKMWIVWVAKDGPTVWTSTHTIYYYDSSLTSAQQIVIAPEDFTLEAYPNPFNLGTNLRVRIGITSEVALEVFDALGRRVLFYDLGKMQPGTRDFYLDGAKLPTGVYICRLASRERFAFVKVLLLR